MSIDSKTNSDLQRPPSDRRRKPQSSGPNGQRIHASHFDAPIPSDGQFRTPSNDTGDASFDRYSRGRT